MPDQDLHKIIHIDLNSDIALNLLKLYLERSKLLFETDLQENHLLELASYLQEALDFSLEQPQLASKRNEIKKQIKILTHSITIAKRINKLAVKPLAEIKASYEFLLANQTASKLSRNYSPEIWSRTGEPTLAGLYEHIDNESDFEIRDDVTKPFRAFFQVAQLKYGNIVGFKEFIALFFNEYYRPEILKKPKLNKPLKLIFRQHLQSLSLAQAKNQN